MEYSGTAFIDYVQSMWLLSSAMLSMCVSVADLKCETDYDPTTVTLTLVSLTFNTDYDAGRVAALTTYR